MTPDEALRILGLNRNFTAADLKVAYRKASVENHPDRGGDAEKMKDINNANDVLSNIAGAKTTTASREAQWRESEESRDVKRKVYADVAVAAFNEHFKPHAFTQQFDKAFGQSFTHKVTKDPSQRESSYGYKTDYVSREDEWTNADRTIVMTARFSISFNDLLNRPVLSQADAETGLNVSVMTDVLVNRKKVKLFQQNYKWRESYRALSDPEVMFPAKKLTAQSGKAAARAMSKRDIMLTFSSELEGRGDDEWMYVPVGDYKVALNRHVFLRVGGWAINGVYPKKGGSRLGMTTGYTSWLEAPEDMNDLWDGLKSLQRAGTHYTVDQIVQFLNGMQDKQKRRMDARRAA